MHGVIDERERANLVVQLARVVFCLSRCISRFYVGMLYRKSLHFHVHRVSRMCKYIHTYRFALLHIRAHGSSVLQLAGTEGLHVGLRYSCSLYYSWQLSVLLPYIVGSLSLTNNGQHSASTYILVRIAPRVLHFRAVHFT